MAFDSATEQVLRRERLIALGGLVAIAAAAWAYLAGLAAELAGAGDGLAGMPGMSEMARLRPWTAAEAGLMLVRWSVMMVAMMTPSATPVILLYARVHRGRGEPRRPLAPTAAFLAGYLAAWIGFGALMTGLQYLLEQAALLSPMMVGTSPLLGGLTLIAAGVYQWLPIKNVCLSHCRSPVSFLSTRWRPGAGGAFRMGLEHGSFCLGCCWALMILLFVGGVMNLAWVAAIAAFVLLEKAAPFGRLIGRVGAFGLIAAGLAVLLGA